MSILISGSYLVQQGQVLNFSDADLQNGAVFLNYTPGTASGGNGSLVDEGDVEIHVRNTGATGMSTVSVSSLLVAAGATFNVDASTFMATGYNATSGSFRNDGVFSVSGGWATGVTGLDLPFHNGGVFTVTGGTNALGIGMGYAAAGAGVSDNTGSIVVTGLYGSTALSFANGGTFVNSGTVQATVSGSTTPAATAISAMGNLTITNTATGKIIASPTGGAHGWAITDGLVGGVLHLDNAGAITGDISVWGPQGLSDGSVILNHGSITGDVRLDAGGGLDLYDGRGGTLSGGVYIGAGIDHIYLGDDGETVYGTPYYGQPAASGTAIVLGGAGADHITGGSGNDLIDGGGGNDVLDGGGGVNTVSYASGGAATVNLSTNYGHNASGTDTLANFQNIIGSAYDDSLTGDAGANVIDGGRGSDVIAGGGGADTFVLGKGIVFDRITDFSLSDGDRIDLSAFRTLHSFADVQPLLSGIGSTLLQLPDHGTVLIQSIGAASLTASNFVFAPRVMGDFNGDASGDILWQNTVNSLVSAWTMNDLQASGISLPSAQGWQAMDAGDFDGNGYSGDILFRNPTTGKVDVWADTAGQMAGLDIGQAGLDWNIMGVGDFNGDGKSDILWRNEQNGYVSVWLMDGQQVSSTYNPGQVGLNWKITGIGDFNGDGVSDILWRNTINGEVDIWSLDAQGHATGAKITSLTSDWQVAGSGDFNGDGKTDILWRNAVSGQAVIWEMNGAQVQGQGPVATLGGQWKVAGVQDLNGDGKADILWRDSGTGQVVGWAMDGIHVDHAGAIATADPAWQIINHHYDWA